MIKSNMKTWLKMFHKTMFEGRTITVRGSLIKELSNFTIEIDPLFPFMDFKHRNLNIDYIRRELLWKIGADRFDTSIQQHAKMWEQVINSDGSYNSNYGQYWFGEQNGFVNAAQQLIKDKYSRRSTIPMLSKEHVEEDVCDTVCTEAITFQIRENKLNCIVHMRSSDQIFGLGTDIPTFAFLQRLMTGYIQVAYPEVSMGSLTITAASSHIYERHFKMVSEILESRAMEPLSSDTLMPLANFREADYIVSVNSRDIENVGPLTKWINETKYDVDYREDVPR